MADMDAAGRGESPAQTLTGPHGHDFTGLARCLSRFSGEEIVFVPNPGNAGDALINLGMYVLFDRLGLRFVTGSRGETYPGRVVVYSGGGALISSYPGSDTFFRRVHRDCAALVLLPHTVRAYGDLIAEMGENCHLFAREQESFDYLARHRTRANIALSHDLAFFLDDASIRRQPWSPAFLRRSGLGWPWLKMGLKFSALGRIDPVLHALRLDIEAPAAPAGAAVPRRNYDLSSVFGSGDMSRGACASTIKALRFVLRRYGRVETNRLHIAVLCGLIGQKVSMQDNSYGKNRAIYEHSMRGRFASVSFDRASSAASGG